MSFARVHRASLGLTQSASLLLAQNVRYSRFDQIQAYSPTTLSTSLSIIPGTGGTRGNLFWGIRATGGPNGGAIIHKDNDFSVFTDVLIAHNTAYGLFFRGDQFAGDGVAKMNTFSRLTLNNNADSGLNVWDDASTIADTIFHNLVVAGNSGTDAALMINQTGVVARTTLSQLAVANNVGAGGGINTNGDNTKVTGNLLIGNNSGANCSVPGGSNPGLTAACTTANASDHNLVSGITGVGTFVQEPASDSANTAENGVGEAPGNTLSDYRNFYRFDSLYRLWGGDNGAVWPAAGKNGQCDYSANPCQIYDWALLASASILRNTTGTTGVLTTNGSPGVSCPSAAAGSQFLTSQTYAYDSNYFSGLNGIEVSGGDGDGKCESGETCVQRYLKAASEIMDDLSGDDDGLCETGERCLYNPNFGAYQGHGTLSSCAFTDGTISGVTMYYYSTNGY